MRKLSTARVVLLFLAIGFGISWAGWLTRAFLLSRGQIVEGSPLAWALFYFGAGISIAGLALVWREQGREGLAAVGRAAFRWKVELHWWALALFAPLLLNGCGLWLWCLAHDVDIGRVALLDALPGFFAPGVLLGLTLGPLCEEFGWRGYLLPKLAERMSPLRAALAIGPVWMIWHTPLGLMPGVYPLFERPPLILAYLIFVTCLSVIFAALHLGSGRSLLLCILFHWTINASDNLLPVLFPDLPQATWQAATNEIGEIAGGGFGFSLWMLAALLAAFFLHRHVREGIRIDADN